MVLYMVRVLRKLPLWWVAQGQRRVSFGKEERAGTLSPYTSWGRSLICREIRRNTMRRIKTALDLIVKVKSHSHVQLFATPWTVPLQDPLLMEFSRQEYMGCSRPSPASSPFFLPPGFLSSLEIFDVSTWILVFKGFPGGAEVKVSICNVGDLGSIPASGRSPGEGNCNPLQYSCLENPMDGGAWWATVHSSQRVGHD